MVFIMCMYDYCDTCGGIFTWTGPTVRRLRRHDTPVEIKWQRNGGLAVQFVSHRVVYEHTCAACKLSAHSNSWFRTTEWEQKGGPVISDNCPICEGKGKLHPYTFKEELCLYCKGEGWVTHDKVAIIPK